MGNLRLGIILAICLALIHAQEEVIKCPGGECVKLHLCRDGEIVTDGSNLIDIRFNPDDPCEHYLLKCCKVPGEEDEELVEPPSSGGQEVVQPPSSHGEIIPVPPSTHGNLNSGDFGSGGTGSGIIGNGGLGSSSVGGGGQQGGSTGALGGGSTGDGGFGSGGSPGGAGGGGGELGGSTGGLGGSTGGLGGSTGGLGVGSSQIGGGGLGGSGADVPPHGPQVGVGGGNCHGQGAINGGGSGFGSGSNVAMWQELSQISHSQMLNWQMGQFPPQMGGLFNNLASSGGQPGLVPGGFGGVASGSASSAFSQSSSQSMGYYESGSISSASSGSFSSGQNIGQSGGSQSGSSAGSSSITSGGSSGSGATATSQSLTQSMKQQGSGSVSGASSGSFSSNQNIGQSVGSQSGASAGSSSITSGGSSGVTSGSGATATSQSLTQSMGQQGSGSVSGASSGSFSSNQNIGQSGGSQSGASAGSSSITSGGSSGVTSGSGASATSQSLTQSMGQQGSGSVSGASSGSFSSNQNIGQSGGSQSGASAGSSSITSGGSSGVTSGSGATATSQSLTQSMGQQGSGSVSGASSGSFSSNQNIGQSGGSQSGASAGSSSITSGGSSGVTSGSGATATSQSLTQSMGQQGSGSVSGASSGSFSSGQNIGQSGGSQSGASAGSSSITSGGSSGVTSGSGAIATSQSLSSGQNIGQSGASAGGSSITSEGMHAPSDTSSVSPPQGDHLGKQTLDHSGSSLSSPSKGQRTVDSSTGQVVGGTSSLQGGIPGSTKGSSVGSQITHSDTKNGSKNPSTEELKSANLIAEKGQISANIPAMPGSANTGHTSIQPNKAQGTHVEGGPAKDVATEVVKDQLTGFGGSNTELQSSDNFNGSKQSSGLIDKLTEGSRDTSNISTADGQGKTGSYVGGQISGQLGAGGAVTPSRKPGVGGSKDLVSGYGSGGSVSGQTKASSSGQHISGSVDNISSQQTVHGTGPTTSITKEQTTSTAEGSIVKQKDFTASGIKGEHQKSTGGSYGGHYTEKHSGKYSHGVHKGSSHDVTANPLVPSQENLGCGIRHADGVGFRITGNNDGESEYGEFPWMVAILKEEKALDQVINVYQCGGSLIHPQVVLTAAHCVQNKQPNEIKIRLGEWDTQTTNEIYDHQDRNVVEIVVHDKFYKGGLFNDVALLFLIKPAEIIDTVNTACLPPQDYNFDLNRCFASGWGKDVFGKEGKYQVILKKIELPVMPFAKCQEALRTTRLGRRFILNKSFICAGGEPGKDTCKGDGGSPLVCPIPGTTNRYYQAGIVAWGIGCGETGIPGVYVNVAGFRKWIDEHLTQRSIPHDYYIYV
ncbi:uncharacterized transmembrane protein DDB_G0289901-like [Malaya genurostris]|uniref:uncharacterized transmembrane protein DDB_G0289901-like n=1 Tax=Malaya genurostris TaxID=325434 RepID=UPI0026F3833A|nr:uncharacterized transmembrane protein DDB_G0289901-like [Malaya genurostris]XP_058459452.1 uncharacterized transmembrane protein DDB_G0289901-like [Malaya genurostris]XP_058459453.1 uncharacterized transmembrane protein DDB_G0289901-like [Malaya genurostris]